MAVSAFHVNDEVSAVRAKFDLNPARLAKFDRAVGGNRCRVAFQNGNRRFFESCVSGIKGIIEPYGIGCGINASAYLVESRPFSVVEDTEDFHGFDIFHRFVNFHVKGKFLAVDICGKILYSRTPCGKRKAFFLSVRDRERNKSVFYGVKYIIHAVQSGCRKRKIHTVRKRIGRQTYGNNQISVDINHGRFLAESVIGNGPDRCRTESGGGIENEIARLYIYPVRSGGILNLGSGVGRSKNGFEFKNIVKGKQHVACIAVGVGEYYIFGISVHVYADGLSDFSVFSRKSAYGQSGLSSAYNVNFAVGAHFGHAAV